MIRHPDIGLMDDTDVDGNEVRPYRSDISWQSTDADPEVHGDCVRSAGVGSQRYDAFDAWHLQHTLRSFFVYLPCFLMHETMILHFVAVLWKSIHVDVRLRREQIDMHSAQPYGNDVLPVGLLELDRDVGLHPKHIRHLHGATQIHDGRGMCAAKTGEVGEDPH